MITQLWADGDQGQHMLCPSSLEPPGPQQLGQRKRAVRVTENPLHQLPGPSRGAALGLGTLVTGVHVSHAGRGDIIAVWQSHSLGPVTTPWNLSFPVSYVLAGKAQLRRHPFHREAWVSSPACASVFPAVKESVTGGMEHGSRHSGQRYPTLRLWPLVTHTLPVCILPCSASTGPLGSQMAR